MNRYSQIFEWKRSNFTSEDIPIIIFFVFGLAKAENLTLMEVNFQNR
jgi:hypothetical protein